MTETLPVDPARPDPDALARAAETLRRGGLVAFPTETVYGLGAHALDADAVARIYAAKGRPSYNPLIVHVADLEAARRLADPWPEAAERLAARFWPGPLTLVVRRASAVPGAVSAGLPTVALRVPAHPVAAALLRAAAIPVAAPSANRSTRVSPSTAEHVRKGLGGRIDLILDGGPAPVGIESTVVDVSGARPVLLRPGAVSADELREVVGPVRQAGTSAPRGEALPSPGMMDRHYAPAAELRLFGRDDADDAARWTAEMRAGGRRVAALVREAEAPGGADEVRMPGDAGGYAARLYATLHELDDAGYGAVLVERVPDGAAWDGVRDRLRRAARRG